MRKAGLLSLGFVLATSMLVLASDPNTAATWDVAVNIAPHTMLLSTQQGGEVVVHADIPYNDVDAGTVYLENIPALRLRPDLEGNLVAFFDEVAVKAIVAPPAYDLELTGTAGGTPFAGSDTGRVRP